MCIHEIQKHLPVSSPKTATLAQQANAADTQWLEQFCDHLWLQDGLAAASLDAYRLDLLALAVFAASQGVPLAEMQAQHLAAYYAASFHAKSAPTSAARRHSCHRRFFTWLVSVNHRQDNPLATLDSVKARRAEPQTLSESQVEALLKTPQQDTPLGLRDQCMLELLYGSGLRVSELVGLKVFEVSTHDSALKVLGKGGKGRMIPYGKQASTVLDLYLKTARPALLNGRISDDLFVTQRAAAAMTDRKSVV